MRLGRALAAVMTISALAAPAAGALPLPSAAPAGWLASGNDPAAVVASLERHRSKLPAEFDARIAHVQDDGLLRVVAATSSRDAGVEAAVDRAAEAVEWSFGHPRFVATVTPDGLAGLLALDAVTHLTPDYPLSHLLAASASDVKARGTGGLWSFQGTGMGSLRSEVDGLDAGQATGKGVTVAVVDSGIDGTHRDFGGFDCATDGPYTPCQTRIKRHVTSEHLIYAGLSEQAGTDTEPEPTNDYVSGHGTHVAGIIAGNGYSARDAGPEADVYGGDGLPIGIAPQAELVSVKNGDTIWAGLALFGLDWVLANHAEYGIRVVNNSWGCATGCAYSPASAEAVAIRSLYRAGLIVTFAAGNGGGGTNGAAFAGNSQSPYTLSVANYDHRNHQLNSGSSRGVGGSALPAPATWDPDAEAAAGAYRRPDLAAPGTLVYSTANLTGGAASLFPRVDTADVTGGGTNGLRPYVRLSGTSMSTPHVSGAAAVLLSACPQAKPLDVMRALMASADAARVTTTGGARVAQAFEVGYGGLDVRGALEWLRSNVIACGYEIPNLDPTAVIAGPASAEGAETVAFGAGGSSDADGSIVSYAWDFGDGATASGAETEHAFARSGSYDVRLTVTDDDGATASALFALVVRNAEPVAAFAAPASLRHEAPAAFDAAGSADRDGTLTGYAWDFGDGASAAGEQVQHAYTWAGTYVVALTVTDDEGATATISRSVTVTDEPDSGFKRLTATGLDNHRCTANRWTFEVRGGSSTDAPASVAVVWADGSRERVAQAGRKGKSTLYSTTASLAQVATRGYGDVPAASPAQLVLAAGPCH